MTKNNEILILPMVYDSILWMAPKIVNFPKKYKFTLGDRLTSLQLELLEKIIDAKYATSGKKSHFLRKANLTLEKLRYLIRLSKDLECISIKAYEFISKQINEIGKMVGGWEIQQKNIKVKST